MIRKAGNGNYGRRLSRAIAVVSNISRQQVYIIYSPISRSLEDSEIQRHKGGQLSIPPDSTVLIEDSRLSPAQTSELLRDGLIEIYRYTCDAGDIIVGDETSLYCLSLTDLFYLELDGLYLLTLSTS